MHSLQLLQGAVVPHISQVRPCAGPDRRWTNVKNRTTASKSSPKCLIKHTCCVENVGLKIPKHIRDGRMFACKQWPFQTTSLSPSGFDNDDAVKLGSVAARCTKPGTKELFDEDIQLDDANAVAILGDELGLSPGLGDALGPA